ENVFVTTDDHVKILDFGLAKRIEPAVNAGETGASTMSALTQAGTVMGTIGYMSPEQVRGLPVDRRSDIFAFGALLYELLTARRAFNGATASDTMAAILLQEPAPVSEAGRTLPTALDGVVRRCLEKDAEKRFQSAGDVVSALSEASHLSTSAAGEPSAAGSSSSAFSVSPKLAIAVVALIGLTAAGFFVARRVHPPPAEPTAIKRIAVLPFENLSGPDDEYFADGVADEVRGKLTSIGGLEVIARVSSIAYKKTSKTPKQIAAELHTPYLLTGTVRSENTAAGRRVHVTPELVDVREPDAPTDLWQQAFDAPLTDVFQVQSDIATKVAQALGRAIGATEQTRLSERPTQNLAAYDAFLKGRAAQSEGRTTDPGSLRRSLGFYEQAVALDPGFAQAWGELSRAATSLYANGVPTSALATEARQAGEKALALASDRPYGYWALGAYEQLVDNNLPRAAELYEKARALSPSESRFLFATAQVEAGLGRWDVAVEQLKQAERATPGAVGIPRFLGTTLLRLRRYPEAHEALDRALALAPANVDAIEYKAMVFVAEGDLAAARRVLAEGLKTAEPAELLAGFANYYSLGFVLDETQRDVLLRLPPSVFDDDRGRWAVCLADASALRGDIAGMRRYASTAAEAFKEQLVSAPKDADRHAELGHALALLGRKQEAMREGELAVALDPVSSDKLYAPFTQHQLVEVYILVGEQEKALDALEPLLKMPYLLSPGWLKIDPAFDPLRRNPRFQKLLEP
ncbi:MAG TPA: protein kinase, partial [Vicinamibacterales bacterium]|nr:protein kinase [Vicinamibacterales bacterium]